MALRYISFNPIRSIGIPCVAYIKPGNMVHSLNQLKQAVAVLFPEYWQINPLVYALKKIIFPSVSTYHLGHDKVEMTRSLQMLCPEYVLKTGIFFHENICFDELVEQFGLPYVCKNIRSSSGLGGFLIRSRNDYACYAQMNPVVYAQEYVPMERDLRGVVIGDRVVAAYWRVGGQDHFHNNVSRGGMICRGDVPENIVEKVLQIAQALEVNYAGFDVAVTSRGIYVLEFNLYFGTRGIPLSSHELGLRIDRYLSESIPAMNMGNQTSCYIPSKNKSIAFAAEII